MSTADPSSLSQHRPNRNSPRLHSGDSAGNGTTVAIDSLASTFRLGDGAAWLSEMGMALARRFFSLRVDEIGRIGYNSLWHSPPIPARGTRPVERTIMTTVSATEFSARASELLEGVESGDTVVVLRNGKAVARLAAEAAEIRSEPLAPETEEEESTPDIFTGDFGSKPLTEFRFGTATMRLERLEPEVNLAWFRQEDDDDA